MLKCRQHRDIPREILRIVVVRRPAADPDHDGVLVVKVEPAGWEDLGLDSPVDHTDPGMRVPTHLGDVLDLPHHHLGTAHAPTQCTRGEHEGELAAWFVEDLSAP